MKNKMNDIINDVTTFIANFYNGNKNKKETIDKLFTKFGFSEKDSLNILNTYNFKNVSEIIESIEKAIINSNLEEKENLKNLVNDVYDSIFSIQTRFHYSESRTLINIIENFLINKYGFTQSDASRIYKYFVTGKNTTILKNVIMEAIENRNKEYEEKSVTQEVKEEKWYVVVDILCDDGEVDTYTLKRTTKEDAEKVKNFLAYLPLKTKMILSVSPDNLSSVPKIPLKES